MLLTLLCLKTSSCRLYIGNFQYLFDDSFAMFADVNHISDKKTSAQNLEKLALPPCPQNVRPLSVHHKFRKIQ